MKANHFAIPFAITILHIILTLPFWFLPSEGSKWYLESTILLCSFLHKVWYKLETQELAFLQREKLILKVFVNSMILLAKQH
jgi:hypothetical protein